MKNLYIFDCFGVVVSDVSTLWMAQHFSAEQQAYCRAEIFRKVDCGLITFDQMIKLLSEMCGMEPAAVLQEWNSYLYPLEETRQLIVDLKQSGGTVALLSNASSSNLMEIFSEFNLLPLFDKLCISSDYGCAKPDVEFYQRCLAIFTERFDNIYFTDDNPKNLVGLQQLGITPLLFTSAQQLRKDLGLK